MSRTHRLRLDLTVGKIEVLVEQGDAVVVANGLSVDGILVKFGAARMTARAELDFALGSARSAALGIAGGGIYRPADAVAFVKRNSQSVIVPGGRGRLAWIARP